MVSLVADPDHDPPRLPSSLAPLPSPSSPPPLFSPCFSSSLSSPLLSAFPSHARQDLAVVLGVLGLALLRRVAAWGVITEENRARLANAGQGCASSTPEGTCIAWWDVTPQHVTGVNAQADWETFLVEGTAFLALASAGTSDSLILRWNSTAGRFASFQTLAGTGGMRGVAAAYVPNSVVLALACGNCSAVSESPLFRWNATAQRFDRFQTLSTAEASDWTAFSIAADSFLLAANTSGASSVLFRWDPSHDRFVPHQELFSAGVASWAAVDTGSQVLLVEACPANLTASLVRSWDAASASFRPLQVLPSNGALRWSTQRNATGSGSDNNALFLVGANGNDATSPLFRWTGSSFVLHQSLSVTQPTDWARVPARTFPPLLALASRSPLTHTSLFRWDASGSLVPQQSLPPLTGAARVLAVHVAGAGVVVAGAKGDDSILYRLATIHGVNVTAVGAARTLVAAVFLPTSTVTGASALTDCLWDPSDASTAPLAQARDRGFRFYLRRPRAPADDSALPIVPGTGASSGDREPEQEPTQVQVECTTASSSLSLGGALADATCQRSALVHCAIPTSSALGGPWRLGIDALAAPAFTTRLASFTQESGATFSSLTPVVTEVASPSMASLPDGCIQLTMERRVNVIGQNFGGLNRVVGSVTAVTVQDQPCTHLSFTTDSFVSCRVHPAATDGPDGPGTMGGRPVRVNVTVRFGGLVSAPFSVCLIPPALTRLVSPNPIPAHEPFVIEGQGLGTEIANLSLVHGASGTAIVCVGPNIVASAGRTQRLQCLLPIPNTDAFFQGRSFQVFLFPTSITSVFPVVPLNHTVSFVAPVVTSLLLGRRSDSNESTSLFVRGRNLLQRDELWILRSQFLPTGPIEPALALGSQACSSTVREAEDLLSCRLPQPSEGRAVPLIATMRSGAPAEASAAVAFFEPPVVDAIEPAVLLLPPANSTSARPVTLILHGRRFGRLSNVVRRIALLGQVCPTFVRVSDTQLRCVDFDLRLLRAILDAEAGGDAAAVDSPVHPVQNLSVALTWGPPGSTTGNSNGGQQDDEEEVVWSDPALLTLVVRPHITRIVPDSISSLETFSIVGRGLGWSESDIRDVLVGGTPCVSWSFISSVLLLCQAPDARSVAALPGFPRLTVSVLHATGCNSTDRAYVEYPRELFVLFPSFHTHPSLAAYPSGFAAGAAGVLPIRPPPTIQALQVPPTRCWLELVDTSSPEVSLVGNASRPLRTTVTDLPLTLAFTNVGLAGPWGSWARIRGICSSPAGVTVATTESIRVTLVTPSLVWWEGARTDPTSTGSSGGGPEALPTPAVWRTPTNDSATSSTGTTTVEPAPWPAQIAPNGAAPVRYAVLAVTTTEEGDELPTPPDLFECFAVFRDGTTPTPADVALVTLAPTALRDRAEGVVSAWELVEDASTGSSSSARPHQAVAALTIASLSASDATLGSPLLLEAECEWGADQTRLRLPPRSVRVVQPAVSWSDGGAESFSLSGLDNAWPVRVHDSLGTVEDSATECILEEEVGATAQGGARLDPFPARRPDRTTGQVSLGGVLTGVSGAWTEVRALCSFWGQNVWSPSRRLVIDILVTDWVVPFPPAFLPSSASDLFFFDPPPAVRVRRQRADQVLATNVSCSLRALNLSSIASVDGPISFLPTSPLDPVIRFETVALRASFGLPAPVLLQVACETSTRQASSPLTTALSVAPLAVRWCTRPDPVAQSQSDMPLWSVAVVDALDPTVLTRPCSSLVASSRWSSIAAATLSCSVAVVNVTDMGETVLQGAFALPSPTTWVAQFGSFALAGTQGRSYSLEVTCQLGALPITPVLDFSITLEGCGPGEEPQGFFCRRCDGNAFSLGGLESSCVGCPRRGVICDNGIIELQQGFFQVESQRGQALGPDSEIHPCWNDIACVVDSENLTYGCTYGYKGPLCGVCDADVNYARFGLACTECWPAVANLVIFLLLVLLFFGTAGALAIRDSNGRRSDSAIALRILLSFLQGLGALGVFKARGTDTFRRIMGFSDGVSANPFSLGPIQCLFRLSFMARFILILLLPVLAALFVILIFVAYVHLRALLCRRPPSSSSSPSPSAPSTSSSTAESALVEEPRSGSSDEAEPPSASAVKAERESAMIPNPLHAFVSAANPTLNRKAPSSSSSSSSSPSSSSTLATTATQRGSSRGSLLAPASPARDLSPAETVQSFFRERKYLASISFLAFLAYMPVVNQSFQALDCYDEPIDGTTYLQEDLTVQCPNLGASVIAILVLLVVGVGLPLSLFLTIRQMTEEELMQAQFLDKFGFLYDGYDLGRGLAWWESVVLVRKAGIVMLATLVVDPFVQLSGALLLLMGSIWVNERWRPYSKIRFVRIESLSLGVLFFTAAMSLVYFRDSENEGLGSAGNSAALDFALTMLLVTANLLMTARLLFEVLRKQSIQLLRTTDLGRRIGTVVHLNLLSVKTTNGPMRNTSLLRTNPLALAQSTGAGLQRGPQDRLAFLPVAASGGPSISIGTSSGVAMGEHGADAPTVSTSGTSGTSGTTMVSSTATSSVAPGGSVRRASGVQVVVLGRRPSGVQVTAANRRPSVVVRR